MAMQSSAIDGAAVAPPSDIAGVPPPSAETRRIQGICDDIIAFRQAHEGRLPNRASNAPPDERRLGNHRYKLRMRCTKALGDKPSERMLNADERALFERAVFEAMPESQSEQPSPKDNTTSGNILSTSGVPPSPDDASVAASWSTQGNKTDRGIKRFTRGQAEQNVDTTASAGKCGKFHRQNLDTAAEANACTVKRKGHAASGASPPTRRPRKSKTGDTL